MTTTAQSIMKTTKHSTQPDIDIMQSIRFNAHHFLDAILKKCSPRRLSSLVFPRASLFGSQEEYESLKRIVEEFTKLHTLQAPHAFVHRLQVFKSPHKILALSITRVRSFWIAPDFLTFCPHITTLTLSFHQLVSIATAPLMKILTQLQNLTTLTLQIEDDSYCQDIGENGFRDVGTTPFKKLKRLNLDARVCYHLIDEFGSIGKAAPLLEELHVFWWGSNGALQNLTNLNVKIFSIHFYCWKSGSVYEKYQAEFMERLSNPQILPGLERLHVMNASNEMVESILTTRPDVIVIRDCSCDFLGAIRREPPDFECDLVLEYLET